MGYDCNNAITYAKELRRMCMSYHICQDCPLQHDPHCLHATAINEKRIKAVQEWSDSHLKLLDKERLIKDFQDYWGCDVAYEDYDLYLSLLNWLKEELEKI